MPTKKKLDARYKFASRVKGKGWIPDPPKREDFPFAFRLAAAHDTPVGSTMQLSKESLDRRAAGLNPPVMNQGNIGSCVGASTRNAVGYLRRVDEDKLSTNYSALQAYFNARKRLGPEFIKQDSGANIRDSIDALRNEGIAPESSWPYKIRRFADKPSASATKAALRWRLGASWRCNTIEEILKAIDLGYAVLGGVSCYDSMFSRTVDRTGVVPFPNTIKEEFLGGHALYWERYTLSDNLIRCENTWGEEEGDGGYYTFPLSYIADRNLADDFWALQSEAPETTPWKTDRDKVLTPMELNLNVQFSDRTETGGETKAVFGEQDDTGPVATEEERQQFQDIAEENSKNLEEREEDR